MGGCGAVWAVWRCCGGGANLKCRVASYCLAHCSSPLGGETRLDAVAQVALWISSRVAWHEKILLSAHGVWGPAMCRGPREKQTNLRRPARRAQARAAEGMPHPMFRSCLGAGCGRAGWWRQQRQSCVGGGGRQRRRNVHSRLKRAWRPVWWCCGGGGGGGARVFGCRRGQRQACRARFVLWLHLGAGGGRARGVLALSVVVALRRTWSCMGVGVGAELERRDAKMGYPQ